MLFPLLKSTPYFCFFSSEAVPCPPFCAFGPEQFFCRGEEPSIACIVLRVSGLVFPLTPLGFVAHSMPLVKRVIHYLRISD